MAAVLVEEDLESLKSLRMLPQETLSLRRLSVLATAAWPLVGVRKLLQKKGMSDDFLLKKGLPYNIKCRCARKIADNALCHWRFHSARTVNLEKIEFQVVKC